MGILNNLVGGKLGGLASSSNVFKAKTTVSDPFRDVLKVGDFMTANVELTASKWVDLGSYTIGAQQQVNVGYGSASLPDNAGYIYVKLIDTGAGTIAGKFRIIVTDSNDVGKGTVFNEDLDQLYGDKNDKAKKIMLPEDTATSHTAFEDEKITLQVYSDATTTLDYDSANTYISIPITRRYLAKK